MRRRKNLGYRVTATLLALLVISISIQLPIHAAESSTDVVDSVPFTENEGDSKAPEIDEDIVDDSIESSVSEPILDESLSTSLASNQEALARSDGEAWKTHKAINYNSGDGSETNPYMIATAEQLSLLAYEVNHGTTYSNKHFKLENDLDLSAYRWNPIGIYKWETDGNSESYVFSGTFDGNGKTISGLTVDERIDKGTAGLFGYIGDDLINGGIPSVKDLTISNASIYTSENGLKMACSGILVGKAMVNNGNRITIENVDVSGTITNESVDGLSYRSGGMVGDATRVDFINCKADKINISGGTSTGGFIGIDADSSFINCKAVGSISGGFSLGGFAGQSISASNIDPSISKYDKCIADVDVVGTDWLLGGFVGYLEEGKIKNSVAYGDVTSSVIGWEPKIGGFVGQSSGTIEHSYAMGSVNGSHQTLMPGGFVGYDEYGTTIKCLFDKTINSTLSAIGSVGNEGTNDVKAGTTQENKNAICTDVFGGHSIDTSWASNPTEHWHLCKNCKEKFEVASHTFGEWVIDTPATEAIKGSKHRVCNVCAQKEIADIPTLPHTHTPDTSWSKDNTNHWNECITKDGEKFEVASHTFGEWVIDTPATDTAKGSKYRDCTICSHREYGEISAEGIAPVDPTDTTKPVETPSSSETPSSGESPSTGDTSSAMLYLGFIILSASVAGYSFKKKVSIKNKV